MTLPDLGSTLPEVALRTALVYAFLVLAFRLVGKREVGQLSILDLVVLLLIADALQNAMVGENTSILGGLIAAATLIVLDRVLRALTDRSRRLRKALEGEPRLLIRDGVVMRRALEAEGIGDEDLMTAIRQHGLDRVEDVHLAILETEGTISVIPSSANSRGNRSPVP
jgi:uncharacterized membrane protein YcaP (DUF421 family)